MENHVQTPIFLLLTYKEWYFLNHYPGNFLLCTCRRFFCWLEQLARFHDTHFAVDHMVSKYKSAGDYHLLYTEEIHFAELQFHVHVLV